MMANEHVEETCPAHKSVPDIETNVRPILSDIAAPEVIDGPRYSISAKVRGGAGGGGGSDGGEPRCACCPSPALSSVLDYHDATYSPFPFYLLLQ